MSTPAQIAAKFAVIDAHDDTVEGFAVIPATSRRKQAAVEVTLFRHWTNVRRLLRITGCANIDLALDTDVLVGNAPINTAALDATADRDLIDALMRRHKKSWHLEYERSIDPLPGKLSRSKQYVLFRVRLFGGLLQVVARSFSIKRIPTSS